MKNISSQIHDTMIHSLLRIMNYKKKKKNYISGNTKHANSENS